MVACAARCSASQVLPIPGSPVIRNSRPRPSIASSRPATSSATSRRASQRIARLRGPRWPPPCEIKRPFPSHPWPLLRGCRNPAGTSSRRNHYLLPSRSHPGEEAALFKPPSVTMQVVGVAGKKADGGPSGGTSSGELRSARVSRSNSDQSCGWPTTREVSGARVATLPRDAGHRGTPCGRWPVGVCWWRTALSCRDCVRSGDGRHRRPAAGSDAHAGTRAQPAIGPSQPHGRCAVRPAERARLNVTMAIRATMANLARDNPSPRAAPRRDDTDRQLLLLHPDPHAPITWER